MKKLLVLLSFFALFCISCLTVPKSIPIDYSYSFDVHGIEKDELFKRANIWMVKHFVSPEAVIEYSDKDAGIFAGKYRFSVQVVYPARISTIWIKSYIQVDCRDERCRISFYTDDLTDDHIELSKPLVEANWKATAIAFDAMVQASDDW